VRQGTAGPGGRKARYKDRQGTARRGKARHGGVRHGTAGQGMSRARFKVGRGVAGLGRAGARRGSRRGLARHEQGEAWPEQGKVQGTCRQWAERQNQSKEGNIMDHQVKQDKIFPLRTATQSYHKGIPTGVDVERLQEFFQTAEDSIITHEEIETALGISRNTCRYRTIVAKWKKQLLDVSNVLLVAQVGVGYKVANPNDRITTATTQHEQGIRRFVRAAEIASKTDVTRLTEEAKRQADHLCRIKSRLILATAASAEQLQVAES